VQQHHAAKVARMPFEAFRSRIETIRDPEVVNQWLAKMRKTTRYTWKTGAKPVAVAATAAVEATPAEPVAPADETAVSPTDVVAPPEAGSAPAAESAPEVAPVAAAPAQPEALTFDSLEDARLYLLTQARDRVVRTTETARFHGKVAETMPTGEIRRAIEGAWERQQRFPLDTANALRGRLRREHFTIFKKGSKGVSYVCAVKRKFRVPGQTFADSIGALITFIENNPMVRAGELASKMLGIAPPAAARPAEAPAAAAPADGSTPAPAKPETALSIEDRARVVRLQGDLMWLVREGYVTEFIDGRLFAPPPMVEARKKEIEAEEHDPENFPEAPPAAAPGRPSAPAPQAAPVTTAPEPSQGGEGVVPEAEVSAAPNPATPYPSEVVPAATMAEASAPDAVVPVAPAPAEVAPAVGVTDAPMPAAVVPPETSPESPAVIPGAPKDPASPAP
jgi:hypothetical protein